MNLSLKLQPGGGRRRICSFPLAAAILLFSLVVAVPAHAVTYGFTQITSNGTIDASDQLSVDVQAATDNSVSFTFHNYVGQQSSITDIYVTGTGGLIDLPGQITSQSPGVSYSLGAAPPNLPAGRPEGFIATASADSNPPVMHNGVNSASEYVTWTFSLISGMRFEDVIAAIDAGVLRIGLHVQGYADGASESFINTPAVPLPASIWMLLSALGGLAFITRRKRTSAA